MYEDTKVSQLVINQLSEEKFRELLENNELDPNQLYCTDDRAGYTPPLLSTLWPDHLLNDMSWLRADTFSWQSGDVYVAAYNHLVADFEGATAETETIGDIEITYYRAEDGHKICLPDQEANLMSLYEATGVAWYYLLDTANKQFKLPRTKFGFTGLRDSVGGYIEPGIPNITGTFTRNAFNSTVGRANEVSGVFTSTSSNGEHSGGGGTGNSYGTVTLDASVGSDIYGNGDTVQPPATQMYLYFYVGNFERDAIEQTAGITVETLNGKADVDLSNMNASQSAKDTIVGWTVPDYSAGVDIAWTNETLKITDKAGAVHNSEAYYIAPADGMVVIYAAVSNGSEHVFVNKNVVENPGTNVYVNARFPVSKGDEIRVVIVGRYRNCQFFPFKGVN